MGRKAFETSEKKWNPHSALKTTLTTAEHNVPRKKSMDSAKVWSTQGTSAGLHRKDRRALLGSPNTLRLL